MKTLYLFDKREILAPKMVYVEVENTKAVLLDHCVVGWVEANRKAFYFVDKKCKQPAKAFIHFGDMKPLANVGFWYQNEHTLLQDLRYQTYWHTAIANYARSFGYAPHENMYFQKIVDFFSNDLSVRISMKKAEMYVDFLLENGFIDCANKELGEEYDILEGFMNYHDDDDSDFEYRLSIKQPYPKDFHIGKIHVYAS